MACSRLVVERAGSTVVDSAPYTKHSKRLGKEYRAGSRKQCSRSNRKEIRISFWKSKGLKFVEHLTKKDWAPFT